MKRLIIVPMVVLLVIAFVITGCGTSSTTTTTPPATSTAPPTTQPTTQPTTTTQPTSTAQPTSTTTKPTSTTAPPTSTTTTPAGAKPISGGTMRIIVSPANAPNVMSYVPDMSPGDAGAVFPAVERLLDAANDRSKGTGLEPLLAQSVDDDVANRRIVFHLRPNVKFHDGSAFNADVVIWNFNLLTDAGRLQYQTYYRGIKKIDDMTVEIDYTTYTNQLLPSWGWMAMYSEQAWNQASGGDLQKGRVWARTHCVGTGPFMLSEFVPGDHLNYVRNPNYWQKDSFGTQLPYLDGINTRYIPDPNTAQNIMLAGQADEWDSPAAQNAQYLVGKGFITPSGFAGLIMDIWPNTINPASPFYSNLKLRQVLEYALDKPAIAKALGFGYYEPLPQIAPQGEWGYDPATAVRGYDVAKAKQLLKDAGYPNGLKINFLIGNDSVSVDTGTTLKGYLDAVGFTTNLDEADPGRFYGTIWGHTTPSQDICWSFSGMDTNYLMTYMRWFSSDPFTNVTFLGRTDAQKAMDMQVEAKPDSAGQQQAAIQVYHYLYDNALVIPVFKSKAFVVSAPYIHTTRMSQGFVRWQSEITWMDKH